ncbi:uncharacterized protein LOC133815209 [Humulus lupulus]|uniref:uncharacterized protein LOC133815209 n=1 Tax=Humulus lupulus TaxID=3486 RepID=UPI002B40DDB0|nr:uncharacterized protein LOC133815209 [Humulus lupulus]
MEDYDFTLQYHLEKANMVIDALSRKPHGTLACLDFEDWKIMIIVGVSNLDGWTVNVKGFLYHKGRLVVANILELRESVMIEAHSSKFYVHPGSTKMYQDLKRQYWWEGMKKDVSNFVAK